MAIFCFKATNTKSSKIYIYNELSRCQEPEVMKYSQFGIEFPNFDGLEMIKD
jgi:hypothetical protein